MSFMLQRKEGFHAVEPQDNRKTRLLQARELNQQVSSMLGCENDRWAPS